MTHSYLLVVSFFITEHTNNNSANTNTPFIVSTVKLYEMSYIYLSFNVRLLSVMRGHSFFFVPATTANVLRLSIPDLIHYIIFVS